MEIVLRRSPQIRPQIFSESEGLCVNADEFVQEKHATNANDHSNAELENRHQMNRNLQQRM